MSISVCYIVQDEEFWIKPSIESVLPIADEIIIVDGGSTDKTLEVIDSFQDDRIKVFHRKWNDDWGDQRTFAAKQATGDWILMMDADEVLGDDSYVLQHIAEEYEKHPERPNVYNMQYKHFIHHFGLLDATHDVHWGIKRFYKRQPDIHYSPRMHETATSKFFSEIGATMHPVIWHCGYLKGIDSVLEKYGKHKAFSESHSQEFLRTWRNWHAWGTYPVRQITQDEIKEIPSALKELLK